MNQPPSFQTTQPVVKKRTGSVFLRVIVGVMGAMGGLVSCPMTIASAFGTVDGGESLGIALAVTLFFGLCMLISAAMMAFALKPRKAPPFTLDANLEQQVLRLANAQGGVLSLGSLAMNSQLSSEQSQIALDELVRRGVATTTFDEDGLLLYRFAGLSRGPAHVAHQKSGAQAELDAFDQELGRTSLDFGSSSPHASQEHLSHHHQKKNS